MTQTHFFKNILGRAMLVSGIAILSFATAAEAGFEWRGPLEPPMKAAPAAPAKDQGMSGLEPVITWDGKSANDVQWGNESVMPVDPASDTTAAQQPSPALAPFVAQTPLEQPVETGDVIAGFGSDLPLAIALQQVVPPGHQFSFAEGVNPGVKVSWEGGKSWQAVLTDMLATQGLGYRVRDNVVVVGYFPATPAAAMTTQAPATDAPMSITAPADEVSANMMQAPEVMDTAPAKNEPVTIRRQRPGNVVHKAVEAEMAAPITEAPASAPAAENIYWQNNDRMAGSVPMSYPPSKTSTAPVPVNSTPPAAQQSIDAPLSTQSMDAPLSTPPDMVMQDDAEMTEADSAPVSVVPETSKAAAPAEIQAPSDTTEVTKAAEPAQAYNVWNGRKGQTLKDTLKQWSDSAGVELYWSIDYDYRLKGDVGFDGSYDQAVASLLDQFASVRPQPYGQLHQAKEGPRVLVVKSYDLTQ